MNCHCAKLAATVIRRISLLISPSPEDWEFLRLAINALSSLRPPSTSYAAEKIGEIQQWCEELERLKDTAEEDRKSELRGWIGQACSNLLQEIADIQLAK